MILIVCLDDSLGMAFNNRRQSSDIAVTERIIRLTSGGRLFVNSYSAGLFAEEACPQLAVDDAFAGSSGKGVFCFAEITDPAPFEAETEAVIAFFWNRRYPYDLQLGLHLDGPQWKRASSEDFKGHSHDRITEVHYTR